MRSVLILVAIICSLYYVLGNVTLQLEVSAGSNKNWMAVRPLNGAVATSSIEVQQKGGSWVKMTFEAAGINAGWFTYNDWSRKTGFRVPVSFRLTGSDGIQIVINNAVSTFPGTVQTFDSFSNYVGGTTTTAPTTTAPTTASPTTVKATTAPTAAPTTVKATAAPTTTVKPTAPPTAAPTTTTVKPTAPPTAAPTTTTVKPTAPPTAAPTTTTVKPTSPPTAAPTTPTTTTKATTAPTSGAPSTAATTKATQGAPSTAATTKATVAGTVNSGASVSSVSSSIGCAEKPKLMVPLYIYPGSGWDEVIAGAAFAKTVAIINPNNGPGGAPDSSYKSYMQKLQNAGVDMVGYVYTSFGARAPSAVKADVDLYAQQWPLVKGIFLDEGTTGASYVPYYKDLYNYIMSMPGYEYSIVNPGTTPDSGYATAATQIMSYEDHVDNFLHSSTPSGANCNTKNQYAAVLYGVTAANIQSAVNEVVAKGYYGWLYVTDRTDVCCIYNTLAPYYTSLATVVGAA